MMMHKKVMLGALVIVLMVAVVLLGTRWFRGQEEGIKATGSIEVTRYDIAPKVSGYLTELSIGKGDKVIQGQLVARISRPDLAAQVLRDGAALQKAQVQLQDLEKGARNQERVELTAVVAAARAVYSKAKLDLERYTDLRAQGAIAQQQLDAAQVAFLTAENSMMAAQARYSLVEEGNRPDVLEAQRLEVTRNKAIVELGRAQLADTEISSPGTGLVQAKNFEQGEFVNAGAAIATIGVLEDCWVKIYIPSTQLGLIKVGQLASIQVDSFPGRVFSGEIKEINQNAEFTPRQSLTQKERANMVFAVKVRVNNADGMLKPGMPADVVIK
jgi:HlyD family secretion protein